jgi:hypothetical protein
MLRTAPFQVDPEVEEVATRSLEADGFTGQDIAFESAPAGGRDARVPFEDL